MYPTKGDSEGGRSDPAGGSRSQETAAPIAPEGWVWICPGCGAREVDIQPGLREVAEDGTTPICPVCRIRMVRAPVSSDDRSPSAT